MSMAITPNTELFFIRASSTVSPDGDPANDLETLLAASSGCVLERLIANFRSMTPAHRPALATGFGRPRR